MHFFYLSLLYFAYHFIQRTDAVSYGTVRFLRNGFGDKTQSWSSGIVEVYVNQWGNICGSSSFGSDEADVICHQLGFTGASSYSNTQSTTMYGTFYSGPAIGEVSCSSSSYLAITQCSFSTSIPCLITNNIIVTCYSTRIWDSPGAGSIRLYGGTYTSEGRLEVYCNGQWGTVCDDNFSGTQARIACGQLGYNNYQTYNHDLSIPSNATQSIWLNLPTTSICSISDNCLTSCAICPAKAITTCSHSDDVTLECEYSNSVDKEDVTSETTCFDKEPAPIGTVRLFRNGSPDITQSWSSGIVQIFYNDQWGNICDDSSFGDDEAEVICHQLGYSGASSFSNTGVTTTWGTDSSNTVIDDLSCGSSSPISITQCPFSTSFSASECNDASDVIVTCYISARWFNPSVGDIRLTGGKYSNEGLLEVYCGGQWGTVCDNSFTATEARIACRQLGYNDFDDYLHLSLKGNSSQFIWLDTTTTCSATSDTCLTSCGKCPENGITTCTHDEDVTLACEYSASDSKVSSVVTIDGACSSGNSGAAYSGGVRLIRDGLPDINKYWSSGIVQIYYNDKWGNICSENFGTNEADVVCHQLGYTGASSYTSTFTSAIWGKDSAPTVFTDVSCSSSSYLTITQCSFTTRIIGTPCDDDSDIIVSCYSARIWDSPSNGDIRLYGGTYTNQGLLEVYCNDQWGTVCDDYFDATKAVISCEQLGYNDYESYENSPLQGTSSQSIWLHKLSDCYTGDSCLTNCGGCPSSRVRGCDHSEDINLICKYTRGPSNKVSTDISNDCDISASASSAVAIGAAVGSVLVFIICLILCVSIPICICMCCGVGIGATAKSGKRNAKIITPTTATGTGTLPAAASYPADPKEQPSTTGNVNAAYSSYPAQPPPSYSTAPNPVYPAQAPFPYPIDESSQLPPAGHPPTDVSQPPPY